MLETAERIPPGRVMTYGDVAEWLGTAGPRQVGRVMALHGGAVPWWRVVRADGVLLPGHERRALAHYRAEGTPLRPAAGGSGVPPRIDMAAARWDGRESTGPGRPDGPDECSGPPERTAGSGPDGPAGPDPDGRAARRTADGAARAAGGARTARVAGAARKGSHREQHPSPGP
ncbi:MGMT family protein [Streptomyces zingiberis]|uniref:MGMT family protein n=1 Tax=Streptomyces zingiberis TaxID=2053010 RepID=UPI0035D403BB